MATIFRTQYSEILINYEEGPDTKTGKFLVTISTPRLNREDENVYMHSHYRKITETLGENSCQKIVTTRLQNCTTTKIITKEIHILCDRSTSQIFLSYEEKPSFSTIHSVKKMSPLSVFEDNWCYQSTFYSKNLMFILLIHYHNGPSFWLPMRCSSWIRIQPQIVQLLIFFTPYTNSLPPIKKIRTYSIRAKVGNPDTDLHNIYFKSPMQHHIRTQ